MCGTPRASSGHRIAIMFPSSTAASSSSSSTHTTTMNSYSLYFRETETEPTTTTAVFRSHDEQTVNLFRTCRRIDLQIERHGDLSSPSPSFSPHSKLKTSTTILPPLYRFQLLRPAEEELWSTSRARFCSGINGRRATENEEEETLEIVLPERLDLGVGSEKGIVGRRVTVLAEGEENQVIGIGMGIVGYD